MNDSPQESTPERIRRFKEVIQEHFKCEAVYIPKRDEDEFCKRFLPQHGPGRVFTFEFSEPPKEHPEARFCFAWDGRNFQKDDNEVVVLDVQVLEDDPKELPFAAVCAWLTDSPADDRLDNYVESKKRSKGQLHKEQVQLNYPDGRFEGGCFFVRERADGKISVRIVQEIEAELNGERDLKNVSFPLTQSQVEKIESPTPIVAYFSLSLP